MLHAPPEGQEGKRVSWLELFYDLVFVAAIIQLGDFLSSDVSLSGFSMFTLHFVPLWVAWSGFTFYANRFDVDDFLHRTLVLAQMFAVGTMAISAPAAIAGEPAAFALAFAVAQGIIASLYLRAWLQVPDARAYAAWWGGVFAVSAAAFVASAPLSAPWCYVPWAVGLGAILAAPMVRTSRALNERYPTDQEHLGERYGLLTIIVLGESFVKVLTYLTEAGHGGPEYLLKGFFNLTLTCCVWWIYFDDVAGSELKKERGSWIAWLLLHIPATLAITGVGVAIKKAIAFDVFDVAPAPQRWLLAGTLALTFLSVAGIDSVTERRNAELSDRMRVGVRATSALVLLLLAQVGGSMTAGAFLGIISALCVAQVLFDMMMAPWEETALMAEAVPTSQLMRQRREDGTPAERPTIGEAVRVGAPAELRRDLYFFFIEGSWTRLWLSLTFVYVVVNIGFAALFQLEPGSIAGQDAQTFAEAFYFSVQTLSSIGYGGLTPATHWANTLVTVEAAVGMLFVAIATGLVFAKASRPQSSVLFSNRLVITVRQGVPTLMLRVANARGNEVVDATMSISAIIDEMSPEGHHMRRLHDLKLVRDRSPVFTMTWLAMHLLEGDSPLCNVDWDDVLALVVTVMGHDGTYGQTTYARKVYVPDDIVHNHRYVDVISQLPDGRLLLSLDRFHDVVPEESQVSEP